jgi:hypothetical protein
LSDIKDELIGESYVGTLQMKGVDLSHEVLQVLADTSKLEVGETGEKYV